MSLLNVQSGPRTLDFINIIDRYLEVSYVYCQRLADEKALIGDACTKDRLSRLVLLLETADISPTDSLVKPLSPEQTQGQSVAPTESVFAETRHYQQIIKERLESHSYNSLTPQNIKKLKSLISLEPQVYLSSFKTVSYAWDILTEFASISFLPSSEKLAARDMIHMHVVELRQHLYRVLAQAKLLTPECVVQLKGEFNVKQLNNLQAKFQLVERVVEKSVHGSISELIEGLHQFIDENDSIHSIIRSKEKDIIMRMNQESSGYPDILEEEISLERAEKICNTLVIYGLGVAYSVWLSFSRYDEKEYGAMLKHCLFCTRTLLDEKRWQICMHIADVCRNIVYDINTQKGAADTRAGAYMMEANRFFSCFMAGQDVSGEVKEWDLSRAHIRYHFLQLILLEKFEDAVSTAKQLLVVDDSGKPNMSVNEFKEWPILAAFRESEHGKTFIAHAEKVEQAPS